MSESLLIETTGTHRRLDPRSAVICALLGLITFALYIRCINFQFINYDDGLYVTANTHVQSGLSWESLRWAMTTNLSGNWHPLTLLGYLIISTCFGTGPVAFHLVNILFHSLNVVLLYSVLCKMTRLRWQSALAAALWGWHPLRVESVAWIAEFKDVLCGCFCLLCLLAYANYRAHPCLRRYFPIPIFLSLALLAKPMAVALPFVLLLLDVWPLGNLGVEKDFWKKRVLEKVPLIILSGIDAAIAAYFQKATHATPSLRWFPMSTRLSNAVLAYVSYFGKTFLPIHLGLFYPHPAMIHRPIPAFEWITAALLLILITIWTVAQIRSRPYLAVGWFWFVGTLVPVIGIVQVGEQAMADRYTYLPSIGLTIFIVWFVADVSRNENVPRKVFVVLGIACSMLLAGSTFLQVGYWQNSRTLFLHSNQIIPDNYLALEHLALWDLANKNNDRAIILSQRAAETAPGDPSAHTILARAYQAADRDKEAMREFNAAIILNSESAPLRNEIGGLLMKEGHIPKAIDQFRESIRLDPLFVPAYQNLAVLLASQEQYDQAIAEWEKALLAEPHNGNTHGWLAEALRITGDRQGAIEHYRAAIAAGEHNPTWETNLAWLLATDPRTSSPEMEQAVSIAEDACNQTQRQQPGALDALAAGLARLGRFDDALSDADLAATLADAQHDPQLALEIRHRADGYRMGRAYLTRQPSQNLPTSSKAG